MKALFIVTSSATGLWLSEATHPYWHLAERGVEVDFASPKGGKVVWDPKSDPRSEQSWEAEDLVSKGFLSDKALATRLETTLALGDLDLEPYDAVHVAGGAGATVDLYPNEDVARVLEHFWARDKIVGAICHGTIALGNLPDRIRGRHVTGFTLVEDAEVERLAEDGFKLPNYPQKILQDAGVEFSHADPWAPVSSAMASW